MPVRCEIVNRRLRPSADFELVAFDRLSPEQLRILHPLPEDPGQYGVLIPKQGLWLGAKAVSHDAARILLDVSRAIDAPPAEVIKWVMDGILEIEIDGTFVSGPAAYGVLRNGSPQPAPPQDRIARISAAALVYAESLPVRDARWLSRRLYSYNALPSTPRKKYTERSAVDPEERSESATFLFEHYQAIPNGAWESWALRVCIDELNGIHFPYKLYVSPYPEDLLRTFGSIVRVFAGNRVVLFKAGKSGEGLLRPDKLVAYFSGFDQLTRVAEQLRLPMQNLRPHGVPFTKAFTSDGLLSWGMDPPIRQPLPGFHIESWRSWVCAKLAVAITHARQRPAEGVSPAAFALDRLELEGVDPATWAPSVSTWS